MSEPVGAQSGPPTDQVTKGRIIFEGNDVTGLMQRPRSTCRSDRTVTFSTWTLRAGPYDAYGTPPPTSLP